MKTLILIFLSLLLMSCSKKEPVPLLVFNTSYTIYEAQGVPKNKRIYLIHGSIRSSRAQWETSVFKPFVNNLISSGYEIITFDMPHFYTEYFYDGGANYRAKFGEQIKTIVAKVNLEHGDLDSIVGGFSFGGLHTLIAMADNPNFFQAYFTILPAVEISALEELRGMASSSFRPMNDVAILSTKPGLLAWGTADYRVNFNYTKDLFALLDPNNTTGMEYVGMTHNTNPQVLTDTFTWILAL